MKLTWLGRCMRCVKRQKADEAMLGWSGGGKGVMDMSSVDMRLVDKRMMDKKWWMGS